MNHSSNTLSDLPKRFISLILAVVMIFNLAGETAAQAVSSSKPKLNVSSEDLEKLLQKKTIAARDNTAVYSPYVRVAETNRQTREMKLKDPDFRRLEEIQRFFFPLVTSSANEPAFETFAKQDAQAVAADAAALRKTIGEEYDNVLKSFEENLASFEAAQIKASTPKTPETPEEAQERAAAIKKDLQKVRASFVERLNQWKRQSLTQVAAEERSARLSVKERFAAYQKASDELRDKVVLEKKAELLALYKRVPAKAAPYLITVAARLLSYRTADGKSFFTEEEKEWLSKLFRRELAENDGCRSASSSHSCNQAFSALAGLGMAAYGTLDDASAVSEFVERHLSVPGAAGPVLLAGASALLSMGRPGSVRGILHAAAAKERNVSFPLSFSELHDFAAYHLGNNQKYLGDVSKFAQFAGENGLVSNGWEELALMLAAEGSPASLQILHDYGVGRCTVVANPDGKNYSVSCDTILPFLAGALISGKSGAEHYAPSGVITASGEYISNAGAGRGVINVSEQEAARGRAHVKNAQAVLQNLSRRSGLPPAAVFSQYLFLCTMGDLNADEELALDSKLYQAYAAAVKGRQIAPEYQIEPYNRGSRAYVLKRSAYDRSKWWGLGANACDVLLLVWFGADIVRNLPKAARWVRLAGNGALASVGKMAAQTRVLGRFGKMGDAAPLMKELASLRPAWSRDLRLKIVSRLDGVVKAQAPMFTSSAFVSAVPKPATLTSEMLSAARFEGGKIRLAPEAVGSSRLALKTQERLDQMALNVNERFRKNAFSLKSRLLNEDYLYRKLWLNELYAAVPRGASAYTVTPNQRALYELAGAVRGNKNMRVPGELKETVSLLSDGKVNPAALKRNLELASVPLSRTQETAAILEQASELANQSYMFRARKMRGLLSFVPFGNDAYRALYGNALYRQLLGKKAGVLINQSSLFTDAEKLKLTETLAWNLRRDYSIQVPRAARSLSALPKRGQAVEYEARAAFVREGAGESAVPLPLTLRMDPRLDGVSDRFYQHVSFTREKTGEYTLSMMNAADKPFKLENFKILAKQSELPKLAQAAQTAGEPLVLTMSPYAKQGWLTRGFNNTRSYLERYSWYPQKWRRGSEETNQLLLLRDNRVLASRVDLTGDKEERFSSLLNVYLRGADGNLSLTPMTVKTDKFFRFGKDGLGIEKMVLEPNQKIVFLDGANQAVNVKNPFFFGIPKGEAGHLVRALRGGKVSQPLSLTVDAKKTEVWRMYVATGLSLSSASTGLLASLEEFYPKNKPYGASDTDKTMITLFLPFVPSLFAPVFTPFVKRYGALNITKAALAVSSAGLAFPLAAGFTWSTPQNKYSDERPEGLPDYQWLYASAAAIGVSSALLRASLNTLIGKASGSSGLVTSMLAKNIGSAALLVPPLVFGGLYSDKGDGLASTPPTFASSFPVLGAGSLFALGVMHTSGINRTIGREKGFKMGNNLYERIVSVGKESAAAYKLVGHKSMLPMMGGAFLLTGFESAAYNKATNQMLKPAAKTWASADWLDTDFANLNQDHQKKNLTATFTGGALLVAPFLARWKAKPILNMLGTEDRVRYAKMLQYSLASSAVGGGLLLSTERGADGNMDAWNWTKFVAGGTLLGLGTANVFQSLQNLATGRYMASEEVLSAVKAASGLKEQKRVGDVYKAASRTVFSAANVGMALPPLVVSTSMDAMTDENRTGGPMILKEQIPSYSLGMSYGFLGLGAGISLGSLGMLKAGGTRTLLNWLAVPVGGKTLYNLTRPAASSAWDLRTPSSYVFPVYPKPLAPLPLMPQQVRDAEPKR